MTARYTQRIKNYHGLDLLVTYLVEHGPPEEAFPHGTIESVEVEEVSVEDFNKEAHNDLAHMFDPDKADRED